MKFGILFYFLLFFLASPSSFASNHHSEVLFNELGASTFFQLHKVSGLNSYTQPLNGYAFNLKTNYISDSKFRVDFSFQHSSSHKAVISHTANPLFSHLSFNYNQNQFLVHLDYLFNGSGQDSLFFGAGLGTGFGYYRNFKNNSTQNPTSYSGHVYEVLINLQVYSSYRLLTISPISLSTKIAYSKSLSESIFSDTVLFFITLSFDNL